MNDLLIATVLDIVRIALIAGSAVGCAYNILFLISTTAYAAIESARQHLETKEPYEKTTKTFGIACKLAFHAFLAYWSFSIFYALVYNHPSTLMYYFHMRNAQ